MTPIESHAIAVSLEARIAVLWRQHQRDKGLPYWTPARHDRDMELRALLRVARSGRRLARGVLERQDAREATDDRSYHDWQARGPVSEPDFDRESQPEFNGAFNR